MSSYKLSLQYPHPSIPSHYYDGGVVYFDLDEGFNLEFFNAPTRTRIDGFSEVAILEFDLPSTPKNDLICALYNDVNFLSPDYNTSISVLCENGGETLPQTALQIGRYVKANSKGRYTATLAFSNDDIVTKLKTTKLCNLMGEVEATLTMDSILNVYQPMTMYDGSGAICYPNQNYGRFYYIDQLSAVLPIHAVEFRPNLFAAAVFERAFCGFRLAGSFIETDFFKKLHSYDLRPDYDMAFASRRKFLSSVIPNATIFPGGVPTDVFQLNETAIFTLLDLVVDGSLPDTFGNDWNNTTFSFGNNRHGVYSFQVKCKAVPDGVGGVVRLGIFKNGTLVESNSTGTPYNIITVNVDVLELLPTDVVEVKYTSVSASGIDAQYIYEVEFKNTPIKDTTPYEGEVFTMRDALNQDTTVYDYIKGISDAFGLCYTINRATGIIGIYPENGTSIFGEAYNKLVNNNLHPLDWSDKCDPDSLSITFPKENKSIKDITVQWKQATDKYITEVLNPKPELYSYYELVNGNGTESFKVENNIFEPSATGRYYFTTDTPDLMTVLPILIDNQNNQKSYNLGHRLFLLVGQIWAGGLTNRYLSEIDAPFDNALLSLGTMFFDGSLVDNSFTTSFVFEKNLTYNQGTDNLYTTFIKTTALERTNTAQFDKPILLSREDFAGYDFTRLVVIRTQLNQTLCKVNMIKGFSLSKDQYTTVTLTPYVPIC
jgi:hypothetical protein